MKAATFSTLKADRRGAYDALGNGDLGPLVSLMDEEMEWRGGRRGLRFWRAPPS